MRGEAAWAETGPSRPEQGSGEVLDEITVTAQKRQESAQTVGLSIAALTADQIEAMNVGGAKDLVNHVAGVLVNDNFGAYSSYVIRGIGRWRCMWTTFIKPTLSRARR